MNVNGGVAVSFLNGNLVLIYELVQLSAAATHALKLSGISYGSWRRPERIFFCTIRLPFTVYSVFS